MTVTTISTRAGFERALDAARAVGSETPLPGLAAPLEAGILARVAEAWDEIESALRDAYWRGRDSARAAIDAAIKRAEEGVAAAGRKAKEVQEALLARLQMYLRTLIDEALAQVRDAIQVGSRTLSLTSVQLSQTVALSGSLKASINEVASLTATGQLVVSSEYGV
jgi:predicted YcjX-like family ATPase